METENVVADNVGERRLQRVGSGTQLTHKVTLQACLPLSGVAGLLPRGVPCGAWPRWVPGAIPSNWRHPHPFQLWLPDDCWAQASLSLGLQDPDGGDHGPFCFSVLVGHGGSHVFSVELGSELAAWELSFQRATFRAVQRTRVSGLLL